MLDCQWGGRFGNKKIEDIWPGIRNSSFLTIRWVGFVQADKAGTHTFRLGAISGGRMMIDGKLLVDAFYGRTWHYYDAAVEMKAGEKKEIVVEGWTWVDGAFRLLWKEPGKDDFAVVPQGALYPSRRKNDQPRWLHRR